MRKLTSLAAAAILTLGLVAPASAAPPEDRVLIIEFGGEVDCDGASLTFDDDRLGERRARPAQRFSTT